MPTKRLGKGLDAIFGEGIDNFIDNINNNEAEVKGNSFKLKVSEVRPNPYQPRKHFDDAALKELAESIKINGVIEPIVVRKSLSGYELVAGERRLRATKLAKIQEIPAILVDFNDTQMMEVSLLENIQREDLSVIEEANAYQQLLDKLNYTQQQLSERVNKSREHIANLLRLLKLPKDVQDLVNKNELPYSQARALLSIDDAKKISELAKRCVKEKLSVVELNKIIKSLGKSQIKTKQPQTKDKFVVDVENKLKKKLGTSVEVSNKTITIKYNNTQDLNRILDILGVIDD